MTTPEMTVHRTPTSITIRIAVRVKRSCASVLEELFEGPDLLLRLLQEEPIPITSASSAKAFLHKHLEALGVHFYWGVGRAIKPLIPLIIEWSATPPSESLVVPIREGCSISEDGRLFLPGLGLLRVYHRESLEKPCEGARYDTTFSVERRSGQFFYVHVDYALPTKYLAEGDIPPERLLEVLKVKRSMAKRRLRTTAERTGKAQKKTESQLLRKARRVLARGGARDTAFGRGYYTYNVFDGLSRRPYQGGRVSPR